MKHILIDLEMCTFQQKKKFIGWKNITTNYYRVQEYN